MEESKRFLKLLKPIRTQLFWHTVRKEGQLFLLSVAIYSFILIILARFLSIPFLEKYLLMGSIVILLVFIYRVWKNRPSVKTAAIVFNQFVDDDRVLSALAFLKQEGSVETLQLRDSVRHMQQQQHHVLKRKKKYIYPKPLLIAGLLFGLSCLSFYIPNQKMETAHQLEKESKLVDKAKKQLKETMAKVKDPVVKKALKEAMKKATAQKDPEAVVKELRKQVNELKLKTLSEQEIKKQLKDWQDELAKSGLTDLAEQLDKRNLEKLEVEMNKLNKNWDQLSQDKKAALSKMTNSDQALTEQELSELMKSLAEALNSEDRLKALAEASQVLEQAERNLQQQINPSSLPTSGQVSSGPSSTTPTESTPTNGSPAGEAPEAGRSTGSGSGQGSGSGSGSGAGSGSGSGSGTGTGSGSGTGGTFGGVGQGTRTLTIPEYLEGKQNLEKDNGELGEGSAQESVGLGPILKGSIRNYEEVYQDYEQAYRESADRLQLPSELNNLVKNYFNNLDPER